MANESLRRVYGYQHHLVEIGDSNQYVETNSAVSNARMMSLAILTKLPVIVQGPRGCGKSFLIRHFASLFNQANSLIELHINDQTDCKSLLGSYVCSEVPGEFIWRNGLITQAVLNGYWVVVDNIDSVPMDFTASIATLLEHRKLQVPDRTFVDAHEKFRIFGTRSIDASNANCDSLLHVPALRYFSCFWQFITLKENSTVEIGFILSSLYPELIWIMEKVMVILSLINDTASARRVGLREIMRVCSRLIRHNESFNSVSGMLTEKQKELCFLETMDVIAASVRDKEEYKRKSHSLANIWGVNDESCLTQWCSIDVDEDTVTIGRIKLRKSGLRSAEFNAPSPQHYLKLMERLANCVSLNESVLLVGETGSGKTTTVQQLSKIIGHKLIVLNLSLSTDAADLLGGFQPVSLKKLFIESYKRFVDLFELTFDQKLSNSEYIQKVNSYYNNQNWKLLLKAFQKAGVSAALKLKSLGNDQLGIEWSNFSAVVDSFVSNLPKLQSGFAFAYVEGLLLTAMRQGHWVLLDEINLASSETLQCLSSVLDPSVLNFRNESNGKLLLLF